MKKCLLIYLLLVCSKNAIADHITGGEIYYTLTSVSGTQYTYNITLKLFMVCNTTREFNDPAYVSFFDKASNERVQDKAVNLSSTQLLNYMPNGQCITNPPNICYRAGYYNFSITLPASKDGYVLSSQVIFRVDGMKNLIAGYDQVGATYTAEIPGNGIISNGPANNSARFMGDDLVAICANNAFSYSFAAKDNDNDKLRYSFCNAYREVTGGFGGGATPTGPPPYFSVPYGQGYNGSVPLGPNVFLDVNTGVISGIAPAEGTYVITVCVEEIRNNQVIATQRKDLQITITSCDIAAATLLPAYSLCADTKTISLTNISTSPLIKTTDWEFIDDEGKIIFTTSDKQATYTFKDTGIYTARLIINKNDICFDSATSTISVYPGFKAGFEFKGVCINKPTQFRDISSSIYGTVNYWNWDFGNNNPTAGFSSLQNPAYTYEGNGTKNVQLITGDTKGCFDTAANTVNIVDKPPLQLAFSDTLICKADSVQLVSNAGGTLTWSPPLYTNNINVPSPVVAPPVTTTYYIQLDDNGCINNDSVIINVVDHVSLSAMADTIICSGDAIPLKIVSDGLKYSWSPASFLNNPAEKIPLATASATTNYTVVASIGSCSAQENIVVSTVDYPVTLAGNDTVICFQTQAILHGFTNGSYFTWQPQTYLQNAATLTPLVTPVATTAYVLAAYDTKGCPKPGLDTVTVTVLPDLKAFAGNDTSVVINQPLQLNASGGINYQWVPATGLSDANIPNPVATYISPTEDIRYKILVSNEAGCVDTAGLTVKVFATKPSVFVPTGFTPNGDGLNDILKPIAAGMQHIETFSIYNRWGKIVFKTSLNGKGWDGTINGIQQSSGTYVWMVKAIDYNGAAYMQKGTVVLIR